MTLEEKGFGLADCLVQLRNDLSVVAAEGEGGDLKFAIQEVDLEFTLVASTKDKADAGVKWYVLSAGVGTELSDVVTQKLTMKLHVVNKVTGERAKVSSKDKKK